ncbi:hypothetical protein JW865_05385 [Candidatus Bathyarchaeota archaeon]|nr:hypothetical protein [Candidatus Bathyarchaeota archaeon]
MRIAVLGAGRIGLRIIKQLEKNSKISIFVVDPRENPPALKDGIISDYYRVNFNLADLVKFLVDLKPDLVLVTTSPEDIGSESVSGLDLFVEALSVELESTLRIPVIGVLRSFI